MRHLDKHELERLAPWLVGLCAIALAIGVRAPSLGEFPFYGDEGVAWRLTSASFAELIAKRHEEVPPFYFFLIRWWSVVFGTSMFALRAFSLVCTLGASAGVFHFCRDVLTQRSDDEAARRRALWIGAVAALLTASSTTHNIYGQYARLYPLALLLGVLTPWTLWRALHAPSGTALRRWVLWAVLSAAHFYTQNLSLLTVFGQSVLAAAIILYEARGNLREAVRSARARQLVIAGLGFVALCLPLVPAILAQHRDPVWHSFAMAPLTLDAALMFFTQTLWPIPFFDASTALLAGFAVILIAIYVAAILRRGLPAAYTIACAVIPYLAAVVLNLSGGPAIMDRYVLWAQPFMIVAIALVIVEYLPRVVAAVAVAAAVICQLWFWYGFAAEVRDGRPGAAAAAAYLETLPRESTAIVVMPDEYLNVLYHARDQGRDFRMFMPPASPERAFGFAVFLLPGEPRVRAEDIDAIETERLVTIDQEGNEDAVPTPSEKRWTLVDTRAFEAPYYPAPLVVQTFTRSGSR